jgi:hypothetical protein
MKGLSPRNLNYMRAFAAYPDRAIVQASLTQLPWFPTHILLDKAESSTERLLNAARTPAPERVKSLFWTARARMTTKHRRTV